MKSVIPLIPHQIQFNSFSEFKKEEYEDELGQKYVRNHIKPEGGNLPSPLSRIGFRYTGGVKEIEDLYLFYQLVRSQDQNFSVPPDFFRNVTDTSLLSVLNEFYGEKWVFSKAPVITPITSGLYEVSGEIETIYSREETFSIKEEISIDPLQIYFRETPDFSLGGVVILTIEALNLTIELSDLGQEVEYQNLISQDDQEIVTQIENNILV